MNDTQPPAPGATPAGPPPGTEDASGDPGFDSTRLRTITDMRRSRQDALLGGVSTGAARYLNLDPVILRILFVVLTFVGGAGIILYVAAWFFLPPEDLPGQPGRSIAAEWFNLEGNEERVRVGGMLAAVVVAALSVVGDAGWAWGGFPWWIVPVSVLVLVFMLLPDRRRNRAAAQGFVPTQPPRPGASEQYADPHAYGRAMAEAKTERIMNRKLARAREPRSNALLGLTASVVAIAMALTRLISESNGGTGWTTYVAIALAVVAVALVLSSFVGDGGPLIVIGLLLAVVLAVGSALPSARIGEQYQAPLTAAQVEPRYAHGIGKVELDLTEVANPQALLGRTVSIDSGVGQTVVIVPNGLDVAVTSELRAGEIRVFDRRTNGSNIELDVPATGARHLTIDIDHRLGNIEVIRK